MADFGNFGDLVGGLGIGYGNRETVRVAGRPFRVAMKLQVLVVNTDRILVD